MPPTTAWWRDEAIFDRMELESPEWRLAALLVSILTLSRVSRPFRF